jgi:hypothetical protein
MQAQSRLVVACACSCARASAVPCVSSHSTWCWVTWAPHPTHPCSAVGDVGHCPGVFVHVCVWAQRLLSSLHSRKQEPPVSVVASCLTPLPSNTHLATPATTISLHMVALWGHTSAQSVAASVAPLTALSSLHTHALTHAHLPRSTSSRRHSGWTCSSRPRFWSLGQVDLDASS